MSDENLQELSLELLRSGDRAEIAHLVDMHSTKIYRLALKMLSNPQDAEDILQNTFLKAIQALPEFEGRSSISTWLYRIAVNESLMTIRRRKPEIQLASKVEDTAYSYKLLLAPNMIPLLKNLEGELSLSLTENGATYISHGGLTIVLHKNQDETLFPEFTSEAWFKRWSHPNTVIFKKADLLSVMNSIGYFTKQGGQYQRFFLEIKDSKAIFTVKGEDEIEEIIDISVDLTDATIAPKALSFSSLSDVLSILNVYDDIEFSLKVTDNEEEIACLSYYNRDESGAIIKLVTIMELNED